MAADLAKTPSAVAVAEQAVVAATKAGVDKQPQQQQSDGSSHKITPKWQRQPAVQPRTLHALLGIPEHVALSQIELIYRAEGNANLVLALPQFKKVLRLPKMLPSSYNQQRQQQQKQIQQPQKQQKQHERQKEKHQRSTVAPVVHQNTRAGDLAMEEFVAYIDIIRGLLGGEFVFEAHVVDIPEESDRKWINEHIKLARPAHRRDKEFCGQFGLLLPDATQLPAAFDILLANLQPDLGATTAAATTTAPAADVATLSGDTYAIEIKPKQGWLLPTDVHDLFDTIKQTTATAATTTAATTTVMTATTPSTACPTTAATAITATTITPVVTPAVATKKATRCRYCAMQYLKLQGHKISRLSSYCPIELFSGMPARMLAALHALLECPQNNLRVFRNGNLIYGDHEESISRQQLKDTVLKGEKLQLIKNLLVTCLLRDYGASVARGAEAGGGAVAETDASVIKAVAGQPHSSATPAPTAATTAPVPASVAVAKETQETEAQATQTRAQISEAEMLCLPENCVLQKILHLQLLAKRNMRYMWQAGYATAEAKSYSALSALLDRAEQVSFGTLQPVEEYLLAATALDCSVMVTYQELPPNTSLPQLHPHVVELPMQQGLYLTKVTLLDLDPKPDSHFCKYVQQTRQASQACQRTS